MSLKSGVVKKVYWLENSYLSNSNVVNLIGFLLSFTYKYTGLCGYLRDLQNFQKEEKPVFLDKG